MHMEVGSPSLPPCVTHAPRDLTRERAPAGGRDGAEQIRWVRWAVIRPQVLSQLVPEGWRRLRGGKEGESAGPTAGSSAAPFLGAAFLPGPSCEGQKRLLKPGGAPAPLTRGQVWDGCLSCKPCPEGSPDGQTGRPGVSFRQDPSEEPSGTAKPQSPQPQRLLKPQPGSPRQDGTSVHKRDRIQETVFSFSLTSSWCTVLHQS